MIRYRQQGSVVLSTQDIASPLLAMTELKDRTAGSASGTWHWQLVACVHPGRRIACLSSKWAVPCGFTLCRDFTPFVWLHYQWSHYVLAQHAAMRPIAGASCVPSGAANPAGSRAQQRHPPCKTQLFHHSRNAATPWPPHLIHLVLSETELVHQHVVRRELRPHGL